MELAGWIAVATVLVAAALSLWPVKNPGVQECGAPAMYLLRGRVDTYPDANGRIQRSDGTVDTLTKAELDRAFSHRCSQRVSKRMIPAGIIFSAGILVGLAVLIASLIGWWRASPPPHPTEE